MRAFFCFSFSFRHQRASARLVAFQRRPFRSFYIPPCWLGFCFEFYEERVRGAHILEAVYDDLLATGGTSKALLELVEQLGGEVVGVAFVIELAFLSGRDKLRGYDIHSLITY